MRLKYCSRNGCLHSPQQLRADTGASPEPSCVTRNFLWRAFKLQSRFVCVFDLFTVLIWD